MLCYTNYDFCKFKSSLEITVHFSIKTSVIHPLASTTAISFDGLPSPLSSPNIRRTPHPFGKALALLRCSCGVLDFLCCLIFRNLAVSRDKEIPTLPRQGCFVHTPPKTHNKPNTLPTTTLNAPIVLRNAAARRNNVKKTVRYCCRPR